MPQAIILDLAPQSYARMTYNGRFNPNAKKYTAYKRAIQVQMQAKKFRPSNCLAMTFYMPMPPSWSKKKCAEMLGRPHMQKNDLDNMIKGILDSMFYGVGDHTVHVIAARKLWSERGQIAVTNLEEEAIWLQDIAL